MSFQTVTFDTDKWQLVPRQATHAMLMDLKPRAGEIVKVIRENGGKRLNFSCDFGLAYQLMLASAPAFSDITRAAR
jgi:hypothetical protein